jgi:hypothetical protein
MTNHLMSRHASPTVLAVGVHCISLSSKSLRSGILQRVFISEMPERTIQKKNEGILYHGPA